MPSSSEHILLQSVEDPVALLAPDGAVLASNPRFDSLDASVREHVIAEARRRFPPPMTPEPRPAASTDAERGVSRFETTLPGGVVFEITLRPSSDETSAPRLVAVLVRDVTAARRLAVRMDALDRAGAELVRLDPDTVRRLNAVERLRLLERKMTRFAHDLLNFDHFAVRLIEDRTGKLELVMSCGMPPEIGDFTLYARAEGNGISGHVAATGVPYLCEDTATDPLFLPGLGGARSSLTIPLKLHDKVIGIMDVESRQPRAFTPEDRRLADVFARYVTLALHMLDVLVVERSTTNQTITGRLEADLAEPLQDIIHEVDILRGAVAGDERTGAHLEQIRADVDKIRRRVKEIAAGPSSILGLERAIAGPRADPLLVGRRVLVADDEPRIRLVIGDLLRARGAEVVLCATGGEAITALEQAASGGTYGAGAGAQYDLIISDIKMPDRNGYEVFSAARRLRADLPVILMTIS